MNPPNSHILKVMFEAGAVPVRDLELEGGRVVSVWRVWDRDDVPPLVLAVEGEGTQLDVITNTVSWYRKRVAKLINSVRGDRTACYIEIEIVLNAARSIVQSTELRVRPRSDVEIWEYLERGFLLHTWWPPPS